MAPGFGNLAPPPPRPAPPSPEEIGAKLVAGKTRDQLVGLHDERARQITDLTLELEQIPKHHPRLDGCKAELAAAKRILAPIRAAIDEFDTQAADQARKAKASRLANPRLKAGVAQYLAATEAVEAAAAAHAQAMREQIAAGEAFAQILGSPEASRRFTLGAACDRFTLGLAEFFEADPRGSGERGVRVLMRLGVNPASVAAKQSLIEQVRELVRDLTGENA